MRYPYRPISWRRQNGSVAVEAALSISLILVPILIFILLFGRYFWYYTAVQKAVHDATLSIAALPIADIRSGRAGSLAQSIIGWETEDFDATTRSSSAPQVDCWYRFPVNSTSLRTFSCGSALTPVAVRTSLTMVVHDPFLSPVMGDSLMIVADMTMRYAER